MAIKVIAPELALSIFCDYSCIYQKKKQYICNGFINEVILVLTT